MKNLTIYVSGGMTGYKDFNYPKFNRVASELRAKGYEVINPATDVKPILASGEEITIEELHKRMESGEVAQDESWKAFLRGDIVAVLLKCNAVYNLKGWKASKGARFENSVARKMGYQFFQEGTEKDLLVA